MASCSLGVPKIKISAVDLSIVRSGSLHIPCNQRSLVKQRPVKYLSLRTSLGSVKAVQVSTFPAAEASATVEVEDSEETKSYPLNAQLVPKPSEVEALVTEICNSSSIAEFELKLGGFRLYVARNVADKSSPQPQPVPAAVTANASTESPDSNGSASSTSLAITKPASSAADQGLMILRSPKVGFFRRSKTIKGKRTPSSCKEKDQVKEGQVLCYIEQLGGQFPIESDVTGEVVKILREDGEPVGYNDALISILPWDQEASLKTKFELVLNFLSHSALCMLLEQINFIHISVFCLSFACLKVLHQHCFIFSVFLINI